MRKLLVLLLASVLLVACSNDGKDEADQTNLDGIEKEDTETEEVHVESTKDPLEAGNIKNNTSAFEDEFGEMFLLKDWFTNDKTNEEGFNQVSFDEYEITYALVLIEDFEGNDLIGVFGEVENNTDEEVQFNDSFLFVTDKKEQTELEHEIRNNKPNTKEKIFNYAKLEYDTPTNVEVEVLPPFTDGESELIDLGEPQEFTFTLED